MELIFSVATTLLLFAPAAVSAGYLRTQSCPGPSTSVVYDFEEFMPGEKIDFLGHGDVEVSAQRFLNRNNAKKKAVPMAFDTVHPTGRDFDLATDDLGMVLIVSEDGVAWNPDNNHNGGVFTFKFNRQNANVNEILILDPEEGGTIKIFKTNGKIKTFAIPIVSNGSRVSIRVEVRGVEKMVVNAKGSAAIAWIKVMYCDEPAPTASPTYSAPPTLAPTLPPIPEGCFSHTGSELSETLYQAAAAALRAALPALANGEKPRLSIGSYYPAAGNASRLYFPIDDRYNPGCEAVMAIDDHGDALGFYRLTTGSGRYYSTCEEIQTTPHFVFQFSGQSDPLEVDTSIEPPFAMSQYLAMY